MSASIRNRSTPSSAAGAVTEKDFHEAFANTPAERLADSRALTDRLHGINNFLVDANADWAKKVKMLGALRGCIISNVPHSADIVIENFGLWKKCLVEGLKELRSTLTREYCITIAFFAVKLRKRFTHMVELLFPNLMTLVKNSVKIISSSATILTEFIAKYVNNSSLATIAAGYLTSKSFPVRVTVIRMFYIMLSEWENGLLIPHINTIKMVIKTGLNDPNASCRTTAQAAYTKFYEKYSRQALELYESLDAIRQKALNHQPSAALCSRPGLARQTSNLGLPRQNSNLGVPRQTSNSALPRQTSNIELPRQNSHVGLSRRLIPKSGPPHSTYKPIVRSSPNPETAPPQMRSSRPSVFGTKRSTSLPRSTSESTMHDLKHRVPDKSSILKVWN